MPERTEALKKAQQKYMEKFSIARVRMERDRYERVQAHAAARGESVNGFIGRAISEAMERDDAGGPQEAAGAAAGAPVSLDTLAAAQRAAEATGETVTAFLLRAVNIQAQRDRSSLALGINPATGEKLNGGKNDA